MPEGKWEDLFHREFQKQIQRLAKRQVSQSGRRHWLVKTFPKHNFSPISGAQTSDVHFHLTISTLLSRIGLLIMQTRASPEVSISFALCTYTII